MMKTNHPTSSNLPPRKMSLPHNIREVGSPTSKPFYIASTATLGAWSSEAPPVQQSSSYQLNFNPFLSPRRQAPQQPVLSPRSLSRSQQQSQQQQQQKQQQQQQQLLLQQQQQLVKSLSRGQQPPSQQPLQQAQQKNKLKHSLFSPRTSMVQPEKTETTPTPRDNKKRMMSLSNLLCSPREPKAQTNEWVNIFSNVSIHDQRKEPKSLGRPFVLPQPEQGSKPLSQIIPQEWAKADDGSMDSNDDQEDQEDDDEPIFDRNGSTDSTDIKLRQFPIPSRDTTEGFLVSRKRWTAEEDKLLADLVAKAGPNRWDKYARYFPGRSGRQVRLRWMNHLRPTLDHKPWTAEEDEFIKQAQKKYGNVWVHIAQLMPGRSDNAIKNRFHTIQRREGKVLSKAIP